MRSFQITVSIGVNGTPPGKLSQGTVLSFRKHRSFENSFVDVRNDLLISCSPRNVRAERSHLLLNTLNLKCFFKDVKGYFHKVSFSTFVCLFLSLTPTTRTHNNKV